MDQPVCLDVPMTTNQTAQERFLEVAANRGWAVKAARIGEYIATNGSRYVRAEFDVRGRMTYVGTKKIRAGWNCPKKIELAIDLLTFASASS